MKRIPATVLPLLIGLLTLSQPVTGQHSVAKHPPITTIAQLTDSIQKVMKRERMPGLMLAITTRDSVLFTGGLGLADVAANKPVSPRTLFRIGSITKMFTALGLLKLIEQGTLSLNDEVRKIAPELPIDNPWESTHPVRVVHLLEHTAGFDDMPLNKVYYLGPTDPRGLAAVQEFSRSLHCRWRPGERMSYANPGFVVAGYLIEKFSKQPYEQYLSTVLLRPLGMTNATLDLHPDRNPLAAKGYTYNNGQYNPVPLLPIIGGADGAMNASAADMTHWIQFFLNDFRTAGGEPLFKPGTLANMERVHSTLAAKAGLKTGYGLANYVHNTNGKTIFQGHNGGIDGFISSFGYSHELGVGYALSNNGGKGTGTIENLIQAFLSRQLPEPKPVTQPVDTKALEPFLGYYRAETPRNELFGFVDRLLGISHISLSGNTVCLKPLFGNVDTLYQTGPLVFRTKTDIVPTFAFTHDADQNRVLIRQGSLNQQTGPFWWFWLIVFGLGLCLMLVAVIAGLVWLIFLVRRELPKKQVWPRLLPMLATLSLAGGFFAFGHLMEHIWETATLNLWTGLVWIGTGLFGLFTILALLLTIRRFAQFKSRGAAWFLLITAILMTSLVGLLAANGWIGIRLWDL